MERQFNSTDDVAMAPPLGNLTLLSAFLVPRLGPEPCLLPYRPCVECEVVNNASRDART